MLWEKLLNHSSVHSVLWSLLHQTTNSTFSLLTPPSLHFLHEFSASSTQLSFQDLYPGKWPLCSMAFPMAAELLLNPSCLQCPASSPLHQEALLEERVALFYSQTAGHCWGGDWGGDFWNQACWKGKVGEISEHPVMRFPFVQQCQLQQPSAGFSILLTLLCMTVAKVPLEVFV